MDREAVLEKLEKLQRLSGSSNENEAYAAILAVRRLVARYNVTEDELQKSAKKVNEEVVVYDTGVVYNLRYKGWVENLSCVLGMHHRCRILLGHSTHTKSYQVRLIGYQSDAEILAVTFRYIVGYMDRRVGELHSQPSMSRMKTDDRYHASRSWAMGFSVGLNEAYKYQNLHEEGCALMCIVPEAVIKFSGQYEVSPDREFTVSRDYFESGRSEGREYLQKDKLTTGGMQYLESK